MKYDEELIIKDLEELFKAELNNTIDCVNTDKGSIAGDPLYIDHIPSDKYIFETLHKGLLNYKGFFIRYGIADTPVREASEENYLEDLRIYFEIATFDKGEKNLNNLMFKLLRYRRALKSVIMNNPDVFRGYAKPLIASLKPTAFPYNSQYSILAIGVEVQASFTTR